MCDKNILVTAPLETRLSRVMARDNTTAEQVKSRMDKQFTDEQKASMADYAIVNDETKSLVLQVLDLHHNFLNGKF